MTLMKAKIYMAMDYDGDNAAGVITLPFCEE